MIFKQILRFYILLYHILYFQLTTKNSKNKGRQKKFQNKMTQIEAKINLSFCIIRTKLRIKSAFYT